MHSEQEIVKLWKSLFPQIIESQNKIQIKLRGQVHTIIKQPAKSQKNNTKQIIYGR